MFFDENEVNIKEEEKKSNNIFHYILLGILFFPSVIVAYIIYIVFFVTLKLRVHISFIPIAFLTTLNILYIKHSNVLYSVVWNHPGTYLRLYLSITILIGFILGYCFILWQARQLQIYPELKFVKGWAQNFKYAPTPFEIIKKKTLSKKLKKGLCYSKDKSPLGVLDAPIELKGDKQYNKTHIVYRSYNEAFKGTLITGGTGSGKSITMLNLMKNDIKAGFPICVIDFKKGPDMAYHLSRWAKEEGIQFYHFVSGSVGNYKNPFCSHQASYDPLAIGTGTSKADMVLGMREWDSASNVYKGRTKSILQSIFFLLENVDRTKVPQIPWEKGGIAQFVSALHIPNLFSLIEAYKSQILGKDLSHGEKSRLNELINFYNEITSGKKDSGLKEQIDGLSVVFRTLIMSNYSDWLAKGETPYHINLFDIATSEQPSIVLFQFNPNEEPDFATYMGSIIMQDLLRVSNYKNAINNKTPFGLYVDEFQSLPPTIIKGIIEKARSARFFATFSSQSLNQIAEADKGEQILNSILDTMYGFILFKGSFEESLEYFSKIIGKTEKKIFRTTGKRNSNIFSLNFKNSRNSVISESLEERYLVTPSMLADLSFPSKENGYKSSAYYITKGTDYKPLSKFSQSFARKFHSIVDNSILEPVPDDFSKNLLTSGIEHINEEISTFDNLEITQEETINNDIINIEESVPNSPIVDKMKQPKPFRELGNILLEQEGLSKKDIKKREGLETKRKLTSFERFSKK